MAKKIHELAKEFQVSSKELLERASELGIEVKNHMSTVDAGSEKALREKTLGKGGSGETKIVKAASKKTEKAEKEDNSKVTVKAANIKLSAEKNPEKPIEADKAPKKAGNVPPMGRPVVSKDVSNRPKPPIGKVVPKDLSDANRKTEVPVQGKTDGDTKPEVKATVKDTPVAEDKKTSVKPHTAVKSTEKPQTKPAVKHVAAKSDDDKATGGHTAANPQTKPPVRKNTPSNKPVVNKNGERLESERPRVKIIKKADKNEPKPVSSRDRRPQRNGSDRNSDRPHGNSDRPRRNDRNDRPGRPGRPDNRGGSQDNRNNRGDFHKKPGDNNGKPPYKKKPAAPVAGTAAKPAAQKKGKNYKKSDHDKFDKFEHAKKNQLHQRGFGGKSLEKKVRKKYNKPKPVVEPEVEVAPIPEGAIVINVPITVAGFCEQTDISKSQAIMSLMKMGIMANINQTLDEDVVQILGSELGLEIIVGKVEEETVEEGIETFEDKAEDLQSRPPIITVMGHVDHGKTSLLDAIRSTHVTEGESGGITQHIGASEVSHNGQKIVFLDTPGHEAFTAMRARGAHVTDIAVLVVAADDGVMPQTVESISHAKAAGVPIIVAINKIDKPGANPDRVKQELTEHGILVEDWGGEVISVPVSAKTGEGIENLLEMILLQAEVLELMANPNRLASGTVIEARLDKARGVIATLLVLNGTLKAGMSVVAGTCAGKIRLMSNYKGEKINKAGPATAVEILGLDEVPQAGDEFNALKDASAAREIAEQRSQKLREEVLAKNSSTTLEQLFSQLQEGEVKDLNLIIKADVQGSVGAIVSSLEKLKNENVRVKIIHTGVGTVTESDIMLAGTSGAVIIGFNVRPSSSIVNMAENEGVQIRTYRVIYDLIKEVKDAMVGMLDPEFKEVVLGQVEIRETFKVPNVGIIGGAYVTEGKVIRNAEIRLVRDGIVVHEGKISSLKRFKDDAKEVLQGFECGIGIEDYNDVKVGDVIECFKMEEIKRGAE